MALFDLTVHGLASFARIDRVSAQRKIARDPLSGVVDGENKVFFTTYSPILSSGSLSAYNSSGSAIAVSSVDYDVGEVELAAAPTTQPQATYTFIPYTTAQQLSFLIAGFQEMESRWFRSLELQDAAGAAADEDSANIYIVNSAGGDPTTGATTFSQSQAQIGFFMACVRYSYLLLRLTGSAVGDFMFRETLRGMTVDKSRMPRNIDMALERAEQAMLQAMYNAQDEYYTDGEHAGAFVGQPMTKEFIDVFEWQEGAETDDNRSQRGNRPYPLSGS